VIVKFQQQFNSYHHGERASFSEADAQSLISRGFAVADEEVKEMKQEETKTPAKGTEPAKTAPLPTRDFAKDAKVVKK